MFLHDFMSVSYSSNSSYSSSFAIQIYDIITSLVFLVMSIKETETIHEQNFISKIYAKFVYSKLLIYQFSPSENWKWLSCVWLFVTPWSIQSMEFSRSEYWSG